MGPADWHVAHGRHERTGTTTGWLDRRHGLDVPTMVDEDIPQRRRRAPPDQGPVVLRREQISGSTTDQRLLDTRDSGDWVHTDPWRVLRIQAEFVEGFGALAKLGPAISVFGSARTPEDHPDYALARRTARLLVEAGFAVITGGGPGIMAAANRGAWEAGGTSVGLGIELPFEQAHEPVGRPRRATSATSSPARRCSSSTPRASWSSPAASAPSTSCSRR